MDELTPALDGYLKLVIDRVEEFKRTRVDAIHKSAHRERELFEQCESSSRWYELLARAQALADREVFGRQGFDHGLLANWFRRRVYLHCLSEKQPDAANLARQLANDISTTARDHGILLLALLEGVQFENTRLIFPGFELRRFSETELETILETKINATFFPRGITSTYRLTDHFYVVVRRRSRFRDPFSIAIEEIFSSNVEHRYSNLPQELEKALIALVLWDWNFIADTRSPEFKRDESWYRPKIPFVLEVSENPFSPPMDAPDVMRLYYEPAIDNNGNEVGDRPGRSPFQFGTSESTEWEDRIRAYAMRRGSVSAYPNWRFLEHALGMMLKAWLTESEFEELLWNVTALEALLGQDVPGLTSLLANRLRDICSGTNERKKAVRRAFIDLYGQRSALVHGSILTPTHRRHVLNARMLAKEAGERMLFLLSEVARAVESKHLPISPDREDILAAIDKVSSGKPVS